MKSASAPAPQLERSITLTGAVALVVGGVVGAGIYALLGPIAAQAGGATWLAFLVAILTSLVGVLPLVQLASALPRAGAGYVFTSRLLFPLAGTVTSSWILLAGACSTCLVSLAFASYALAFVPFQWPIHWVGLTLVLLFYAVYQFGMRLAMGLQIVMAAQLMAALLLYGVAGAFHVDLHLALRSPQGIQGFGMAVLLCFNTCLGFQILAEMGEEIRDARRTIPRALLIGGGTVAVTYLLIGTVFVNSFPYSAEAFQTMEAPVNASAKLFLPAWLVVFVNFGAITAGLTSFNAAAVALPREIFAQARDGILPSFLAAIHPRTKSPINAVTVFFLLVVIGLLARRDIDFYGYMAATGIQIMTTVICFASLRLETRYPHHYASAYLHIPRPLLIACTVLTSIASLGFILLLSVERPSVAIAYTVLTLLAAAYHRARVPWLIKQGIPWQERIAAIPGTDEETGPSAQ